MSQAGEEHHKGSAQDNPQCSSGENHHGDHEHGEKNDKDQSHSLMLLPVGHRRRGVLDDDERQTGRLIHRGYPDGSMRFCKALVRSGGFPGRFAMHTNRRTKCTSIGGWLSWFQAGDQNTTLNKYTIIPTRTMTTMIPMSSLITHICLSSRRPLISTV